MKMTPTWGQRKKAQSMKAIVPTIFLLSVGLVSGCSSTAGLRSDSAGYQYRGEKFGQVTVTPATAIANDADKAARLKELALDGKILAQLKGAGIYESGSPNQVSVLINSIRVRNAFNAVMFGFMAGSDNIDGTVTLKSDTGSLASFDVTASYALGGIAGGNNGVRLGWLGDKFAEQTVNIIQGKAP